MPLIETEFLLERTTKNTYRYAEVADESGDVKIGTIYLQKTAAGSPAPKKIRVIVEVLD